MKVLVLSGYGINCETETLHAFEVVGFKGKIVHINDLIDNPKQLNDYQVFALPGGFSYGDDTGSGNAMAKKIMNNLYDALLNFEMKKADPKHAFPFDIKGQLNYTFKSKIFLFIEAI